MPAADDTNTSRMDSAAAADRRHPHPSLQPAAAEAVLLPALTDTPSSAQLQ